MGGYPADGLILFTAFHRNNELTIRHCFGVVLHPALRGSLRSQSEKNWRTKWTGPGSAR
jgi:hypothetical protein